MKLRLIGHDSRYAMEQLALILFPQEKIEYIQEDFTGDGAVSTLHQGESWITATAKITRNGETARGIARCRREKITEPLRRRSSAELLPGGTAFSGCTTFLGGAVRCAAHEAGVPASDGRGKSSVCGSDAAGGL
mgnify:CR=1 FL=1